MLNADFRITLDACVLANQGVCDIFLRLAETPRLYLPQFTPKILDEADSTHEKLGWPERLVKSWRSAVEEHFPEAIVHGYEEFLPLAKNDEKDRHVLAAAICSQSEHIITFNLRHFPTAALEPFRNRAMHPSEYLVTLYDINPGVVVAKIEAMARARGKRPEEMLALLSKSVPAFAVHVADALDWQLP